jgi:amidase
MAAFGEYGRYDGMGLAELVRGGQVSPAELCEEAIRRAEDLNPKLNAIIRPLYDFARKAAQTRNPEAPFCGVPFLLKDVHHALKGYVMSSGSALLRNFVPNQDAEIVRRFKDAGLVILGKTNTPEFKLSSLTEPKAFGPTRNPWNPDYSPGGSSGGSAAAVAARIVPLASATDEGGSIRIPASYCGLFGLKPSRGRNPVGPDFDQEWDGMSTSHVLTRSVRDSAAMLDALAGREPGAPYATTSERTFLDEILNEPGRLRIGFYLRTAYGRKVHPECVKAVEDSCKLLEGLGHHIEEISPGFEEEEAALNWCIVMTGNEAAHVGKLIEIYGRSKVMANIELANRVLYRIGQSLKAVDFVKAKRRWRQFGMTMDRVLTECDLILTSTLGEPPVRVGSQQPTKADERSMKLLASFAGKILVSSKKRTDAIFADLVRNTMRGQMPFTFVANMTGQPAMSVPLHWTEDGLPCGVQFLGRFGGEATLLRLASQLEKAKPWADRRPAV